MRSLRALASRASVAVILAASFLSPQALSAEPQRYSLHFVRVDVRSIAERVALATSKTIIVDYRIKEPLTLEAPGSVSADEFYEAFVRALTDQGLYVTVRRNGTVLISTKKMPAPSPDMEGFITI